SMSGTSMAAPHVAGLAAYIMALEGISGGAVCDRLKELGSGVVTDPGAGTPTNILINNNVGNSSPSKGGDKTPTPKQPTPQQPSPEEPSAPVPQPPAPQPPSQPPTPQHPHTPYPGSGGFDFDGFWKKYFGGDHWRKTFSNFWN
ncbi:Transcriptional coactivator, partial [Arthroderma sp. PD_2]